MTEAWQHAKEIAGLLPRTAQWSFCITDIEEDAVFNIYAPIEAWHALRVLLALGRAEYRFDDTRLGGMSFEEHNVGGLIVSLISQEESNEQRDEPHPGDGIDDPAGNGPGGW